jgi:hypothetical protein
MSMKHVQSNRSREPLDGKGAKLPKHFRPGSEASAAQRLIKGKSGRTDRVSSIALSSSRAHQGRPPWVGFFHGIANFFILQIGQVGL